MNTPNDAPTTEHPLPRNAARLAERAAGGGWKVTTETAPTSASVTLKARVKDGRGSQAVEIFCLWEADKANGLRWRYGSLRKDGRPIADPFGWRDVGHLLGTFAPGMIDMTREETDLTHHGRETLWWQHDAREQAAAAAREASGVRQVHSRLQEQQAAGVAWAAHALASVTMELGRADDAAQAAQTLSAEARSAGARQAFELAEEARVLAEVCAMAAQKARAVALGAEADAECVPYVAAQQAADDAEETKWRAQHPDGGPEEFALAVIEAYEVPARDFARWWTENSRPGWTFLQGWDAFRPGGDPRAELGAYAALEEETNRAVYALGLAAAALLRDGDDAQAQQERARTLEEESLRGRALYEPGARRRTGEGHQVAVRVWSALVGRGWNVWLSLDVLQDLVILERWEKAGAVQEVGALRRLLLVDHALRARQTRHAAVRDALKAEESARYRAAEKVYAAAREAGEDQESAEWARRDALARLGADAAGRQEDGRGRFARGAQVWVEPDADEAGAVRYASRIAAYLGQGRFRVSGPVGLVAREVPVHRMSPAQAEEAAADRARQERDDAERRERRTAAAAEEAERAALAKAERDAVQARLAARERAAAGTMAPVAEGGQWQPVHPVPRSVGELWAAAARGGWRMTCRTGTDGRMLVVRISGTTGQGRWVFELLWLGFDGRYGVSQHHSLAKWADGRSGPRGGRIKPTVSDVLSVMATETKEGAAAQLGELVGGAGRVEVTGRGVQA
ncbi:hypothetical protein OG871_40590 (plasmid) [Kitasatospora sp. NBC_00374]|uniref:hypothetical protein n=1 Tax=Kitasatospora sp. NBC_00374 TaxID=2975964 RepID=UPI00324AC319